MRKRLVASYRPCSTNLTSRNKARSAPSKLLPSPPANLIHVLLAPNFTGQATAIPWLASPRLVVYTSISTCLLQSSQSRAPRNACRTMKPRQSAPLDRLNPGRRGLREMIASMVLVCTCSMSRLATKAGSQSIGQAVMAKGKVKC